VVELPFTITSRAVGRTMMLAIASINDDEVTSERYAMGSGKRRREISDLWSKDSRLCNGTCVLPADIERRLEELESQTKKAIDERDEELAALADSAVELPGRETKERGPSQATRLVDLVVNTPELELWHDSEGNGYVTIPVDDHFENWPTGSKMFRRWASRLFYESFDKVPGGQALQDAITTLEGHAVHSELEHSVSVRLAFTSDAIFLDLCDEDWQAVEIRPTGWQVAKNPPVKFRRPRGAMPLPKPVPGGDLRELRRFINVGNDEQFILSVAFLIGTFMPNGPYPILEVGGEQGSAKSTTCRVLRRLVDPNKSDLRSPPRDERDLVIAATNGHIVGFDNLSTVPDWLSDALCRIATGSGFGTRELFTDREEILFSGARPVITNGIGGLATRADLLDRTIRIDCPRIKKCDRRPEKSFWRDFDAARPRLLGALLDAVVAALGAWQSIHLEESERMSDFCHWVAAAEPKLPWNPGDFDRAYRGDREAVNQAAIEASPVGEAMVQFAQSLSEPWSGRATDLLPVLIPFAGGEQGTRALGSQWPKDGRGLSVKLRRIAPNLRALGVEVIVPEEGGRSATARIFTVRSTVQSTVTSVTSLDQTEAASLGDAGMTNSDESLRKNRDEHDACDAGHPIASDSDCDSDRLEREAIQDVEREAEENDRKS